MRKIDKQLVCRQFRRAADSYDDQAIIQHRVADRLLALAARHVGNKPVRVLEIGCCTGLLTRRLLDSGINISTLALNDLMPDFAERLNPSIPSAEVTFLPGDIETTPLSGTFDLIISSSTFHWLDDLDGLLEKLASSLSPEGTLAFSLYGPDNLREIKKLTDVGLDYLSLPQIAAIVSKYYTLDHSGQQREVFYFSEPTDVLGHLRQTGVNAVSRTPWNRMRLQRFCREYRLRFSVDQSVRLTYHPLYFTAHR